MPMIFATDLDNTMIFSLKRVGSLEKSFQCVEFRNGNPVSFMSYSSIEKLKKLMSSAHVIPVTARSLSQFERVEIFSSCEFAIVANGATILHNGIRYKAWDTQIQKILSMYDLENALNIFGKLPSLTYEPKIVDGSFVFAKSDDVDGCKKLLQSTLDTKIWSLSFQGKKVYAIPSKISKGSALKYISENLIQNAYPIISAGDSNLDLPMLDFADIGIIPSDSSLASLNTGKHFIKAGTGIYANECILDLAISKLKSEC